MNVIDQYVAFLPLITGTLAFVGVLWGGTRFFYNRYTKGLDDRINRCTKEALVDHDKRIGILEEGFKSFKEFFFKNTKRVD